MKYIINVDVETKNVAGGGQTHCPSAQHEAFGRHFDLTVHMLGCSKRSAREANRSTRYWDDNDGKGYTLDEVVQQVHALESQHREAHARRCRSCAIEANSPHWD